MIADAPVLVTPLSEEILAFAEEQGVSAELPAVLRMTQRLHPGARLDLTIDIDPEIENDRHLLIHATGVDLTVDQAVDTQWEWNRQLFECCPAPLVCVFRLWVEGIR